jgi:hypothetical protein
MHLECLSTANKSIRHLTHAIATFSLHTPQDLEKLGLILVNKKPFLA